MDKKLLKNKKYIGEGLNGICYELTSGEVLKLFKVSSDLEDIEKYKSFLKYKNNSILFPYEFLTKRNKFIGYISEKASGEALDKSILLYDFEQMYLSAKKLEQDIRHVSNGNIYMHDLHSKNIFYDGNEFNIIDTDAYNFSHFDEETLYYINIKKIKRAILEALYDELFKKGFPNSNSKVYHELRKYCVWDYDISDAFLNFKNIIEDHSNQKVKTIGQLVKKD